jgi:hypothetical protein
MAGFQKSDFTTAGGAPDLVFEIWGTRSVDPAVLYSACIEKTTAGLSTPERFPFTS